MSIIMFLVVSFLMGFIAAIPIWATQLEIARRSMSGYPGSALMIVLGAVISDALYGAIAIFGIAPFVRDIQVAAIFGFANGVILMSAGIWTVIGIGKSVKVDLKKDNILQNKNNSFFTGLTLAVANPIMIYWWLLGEKFLSDFKLFDAAGNSAALFFLAAGSLGICSYLVILSIGMYKIRKFFSENSIKRTAAGFSIFLIGLSIYFIAKSVAEL